MRAVETIEGFTCTAMFSKGPRPRPAKRVDTNKSLLNYVLVEIFILNLRLRARWNCS